MKTLTLMRTGEVYTYNGGAVEGVRSLLALPDGTELEAVERGNGYKRMASGSYEIKHAYWTGRSGQRVRALRVLGGASWNPRLRTFRIYIHPANWPHQLTGCIAPGLGRSSTGVTESRQAMDRIWASLGGFELGRVDRLRVIG